MLALIAVGLSAAMAMAQTTGPTASSISPSSITGSTPASITMPSSSSSSLSSSSTSTDVPLALWGAANSLLSEYYPSTTLTGLSGISWPATVTTGSSTYSVHPASSTSSPPNSSQTAGAVSSAPAMRSDAKIGIAIGVIVGIVALIVLTVVLCCLKKRRRATGAYFKRRSTPSITESEIGAWSRGQPPARSHGPVRGWNGQNVDHLAPAAPVMAMHPAYIHHNPSPTTSEELRFYTPQERSMTELAHYDMATDAKRHVHPDEEEMLQKRSSPFSPALMSGAGHQTLEHHYNPFLSPEDDEANDVVSPIIPSKSPDRRYSPTVHYPSWGEVSEFDFGDNRARQPVRGPLNREDGGDGWRPPRREFAAGRSELA